MTYSDYSHRISAAYRFPEPSSQIDFDQCNTAIRLLEACQTLAANILDPKTIKQPVSNKNILERIVKALAPALASKDKAPAKPGFNFSYAPSTTNVNIGNKTTINPQAPQCSSGRLFQETTQSKPAEKKKKEGLSDGERGLLLGVFTAAAAGFAYLLGKSAIEGDHLKDLKQVFKKEIKFPMARLNDSDQKLAYATDVNGILEDSERVLNNQRKVHRQYRLTLCALLAASALVIVGVVLNIIPFIQVGVILFVGAGLFAIYSRAKKNGIVRKDQNQLHEIGRRSAKVIEYLQNLKLSLDAPPPYAIDDAPLPLPSAPYLPQSLGSQDQGSCPPLYKAGV